MNDIIIPTLGSLIAAFIIICSWWLPFWLFNLLQRQPKKLNLMLLKIAIIMFAAISATFYLALKFKYKPGQLGNDVRIHHLDMVVREYVMPTGIFFTLLLPIWWFFLISGIAAKFNIISPFMAFIALFSTLVMVYVGYILSFGIAFTYAGSYP